MISAPENKGAPPNGARAHGKARAGNQLGQKYVDIMAKINKGQKAGRLTKAQADALRTKVKSIRKQELDLMKANGKKLLTDAQATELSQQLNQVQTSL